MNYFLIVWDFIDWARQQGIPVGPGRGSAAGSIIAFHRKNSDFSAGETGLICSFGAGYSAGTVFVRKR